jgi:hypothetical protein
MQSKRALVRIEEILVSYSFEIEKVLVSYSFDIEKALVSHSFNNPYHSADSIAFFSRLL